MKSPTRATRDVSVSACEFWGDVVWSLEPLVALFNRFSCPWTLPFPKTWRRGCAIGRLLRGGGLHGQEGWKDGWWMAGWRRLSDVTLVVYGWERGRSSMLLLWNCSFPSTVAEVTMGSRSCCRQNGGGWQWREHALFKSTSVLTKTAWPKPRHAHVSLLGT